MCTASWYTTFGEQTHTKCLWTTDRRSSPPSTSMSPPSTPTAGAPLCFFRCYGAPLALHSFPTRRSSDLPIGLAYVPAELASVGSTFEVKIRDKAAKARVI